MAAMSITDVMYQYFRGKGIPPGYKEDFIDFTVALVDAGVTKTTPTFLDGTEYIIKEIRVYIPTPQADAYIRLNTAATDAAATRFGTAYYQAGSFIIFDGNQNGRIGGVLSTEPNLYTTAGTGATGNQTAVVTVHYYYK